MCLLLRVQSVPLLLPTGEALSGAPFLQSGVQGADSQVLEVGGVSGLLLDCACLQGEGVLSCWCQESGGQGCVCRSRGRARPTLELWRPRRYNYIHDCMSAKKLSTAAECSIVIIIIYITILQCLIFITKMLSKLIVILCRWCRQDWPSGVY